MSGSINKVILVGNLGADPEIRHTQDGRPIANLSVATTESWRDKNTGEKKTKSEWHRVVIFSEGLCKVAESYLKKGSKVYLEGQLQTRKWQDQQGQDKYSTEIVLQGFSSTLVMLDSRNDNEGSGYGQGSSQSASNGYSQPNIDDTAQKYANSLGGQVQGGVNAMAADMEDEIPFGCEWRG